MRVGCINHNRDLESIIGLPSFSMRTVALRRVAIFSGYTLRFFIFVFSLVYSGYLRSFGPVMATVSRYRLRCRLPMRR